MKYTLITGASSGIGYETALAFAKRGKNLILIARRKDNLLELKKKILEINSNLDVIVYTADLSNVENVYKLYNDFKDKHIETFINNAGFGSFSLIENQDVHKAEMLVMLNIQALTLLSTLYTKDYKDVDGAQLINISSGGGYVIIANAVNYCASKFYVSAFTEGLAQELIDNGSKLRAKVLAPAATETEFAKVANDLDNFDYNTSLPKFHTSKEVSGFLMNLYDSDKIVGIVDGNTYEFRLCDPIFTYAKRDSIKLVK
ncbi:MAG: SDR family NAD(P)-dependent oxidoreductase [Sarcina sp.]